jgi:hypothetical protein
MLSFAIYKSCIVKGHGHEADFLGFLQKLVPHESITLPFEPFRFWLRIRGVFVIEKQLPHSLSRGVDKIAYSYPFFKPLNKSMVIVRNVPGLFFAKMVL